MANAPLDVDQQLSSNVLLKEKNRFTLTATNSFITHFAESQDNLMQLAQIDSAIGLKYQAIPKYQKCPHPPCGMESSNCRRGSRRELQGSEAADQVAAFQPDAHRFAS